VLIESFAIARMTPVTLFRMAQLFALQITRISQLGEMRRARPVHNTIFFHARIRDKESHMRQISALLLITSMLAISGCQKHTDKVAFEAGRTVTSVQRTELLEFDFTSEITTLQFVNRTESIAVSGRVGMTAAYAKVHTEADEKILGAYRLPLNQLWCAQDVMAQVSRYISKQGIVPEAGIDLFPELGTQAGYINFLAMSPSDRFLKYRNAINPSTGRFYRSFTSDPAIEPGGIRIELCTPEGVSWRDTEGNSIALADDNGGTIPLNGMYMFSVYGSSPGALLYTTHCGFQTSCE
jgi:hypothetical protein